MNAVKNCLVVLAAAVALASCSADPNSNSAGKAVLTVTPGSLALRVNSTAEVFASAMDPLGGAANGSYTVTNATPSLFSAVIDTAYTPVSGGSNLSTRTRIVVTALAEGNGSFTVAGTGGSQTIQVRVAPDSLAFNATISSVNPLIGATIGATDTITAPTGIRFTAATGVSMTGSNGLAAPSVVGFSSDSTAVYILMAPGAHGKFLLTGIANTTTPSLAYVAATKDTAYVTPVTSFPAAFSSASPAQNQIDTITITNGSWKFTPGSTISLANGDPIILGMAPDSTALYIVPTPIPSAAAAAGLTVTGLKYSPYPALVFSLPTSAAVTRPVLADLGGDDPAGVVPTFNLPAAGNYGFFDIGSFTVEDQSADGGGPGINSQVYRLVLGAAGTIVSTVSWNVGRDVDVMLLDDGATTGGASHGGFSGATAGKPETQNSGALTAGTYLLDLIDWSPAYPDTPAVGATIRMAITVQ